MRDFKGMKRQRGRNRGGGGNQGKPQQNANRAFESNGPDNVKIRGNAQHVFERYQQLARDAASAGDRVLAENYLQHAEHYFRVIRALQPTRTTQEIIGRETYTSGFDIDFEDESGAQAEPEVVEAQEGGEGEGQQHQGQRQDRFEGRDRQRDDRQRDDRPRDDRQRDDRQRDERPRDDRPRDDRPREDRGDRPPRDRNRDRDRDRPFNRDRDRDRGDRPPREERAAEPAAAAEPVEAPAEPQGAVLRSEDGGSSHMPAFLQAREPRAEAPAAEEAGEERPKPRRRRAPRSFENQSEPAGSEEA